MSIDMPTAPGPSRSTREPVAKVHWVKTALLAVATTVAVLTVSYAAVITNLIGRQ